MSGLAVQTAVLAAGAGLLGLLAFFEPCTIATHTLFAVRAHRGPRRDCCRGLLAVWLTRSLALAGILAAAVALLPRPDRGPWFPSVALAVMATVYVVSRYVYLPVPHLELWRLVPGGGRLPEGVRLGLTLPACTIPLFAIVLGWALAVDSVPVAAGAGALFATAFAAPMAVAALRGLHEGGRELLERAAAATPWLTAALLYGAALWLAARALDVGPDTLRAALAEPGPAGPWLAFVAGFVFSFNPVAFASIPVALAYVTHAREPGRARRMGLAFVAGMLVTHALLGTAAAWAGDSVRTVMGRWWGVVLGPVLILLGLVWGGWLRVRAPWPGVRARRVDGLWGAFVLGGPFSVAVCPFCTPALLVTLTAAAAVGSPAYGLALATAFAAGRALPVLAGVWGVAWLESLRVVARHQRALEIVGGLTLVAVGLYLLNEYFFVVGY